MTLTPNCCSVASFSLSRALECAEVSNAAARDNALVNCCAGCVECIFNAGLLLFHLDFGSCTDLDHGNAADKLGKTLLELLTVVIAGGLFDLGADHLDAAGNVSFFAGAVDDGGVVLVDGDPLGLTEHIDGGVLELEADLFGDDLCRRSERRYLRALPCGGRRSREP